MTWDRHRVRITWGVLLTLQMGLVCGIVSSQTTKTPKPEANQSGAKVYEQQCASCHGKKGEGTKFYTKPLYGTQTVGQLAQFISKNMPPGPKKCSVPDSQKVAAFMYDAFYSPVAQERNRPPRIELSRLTVRQYQNAVADLIGGFRPAPKLDAQRGLRGEYFRGRRLQRNEKALDRIDPNIQFNYGTGTPTPEQKDPYLFSMRWEGSLIAPETGEYEIKVRTEHAVNLWLNSNNKPTIDAWVKSGNDTEYSANVFLIGGRLYPLRLEFSKANQGVEDQDKSKQKPPLPAMLALEWKRPKQAFETIPQRCLVPVSAPVSFALSTSFPPDDRSIGYERGNTISKTWSEAQTRAALETAAFVVANLQQFTGVSDTDSNRTAAYKSFCQRFITKAFRAPLTPELESVYIDKQFEATPDPATAVRRVVLLTLKSPRFLYRELGGDSKDPYNVASRLSFGLWDSLPDDDLLHAAAKGELSTREQVVKQAERMLADPRAWTKLKEFLLFWLKVDHHPDIAKNKKFYPNFDEHTQTDLRTSLELFLEMVVWNQKSDYRELMLTEKLLLNGRLAKLYGVEMKEDAPFQAVTFKPNERSGVITHPYLMASFAYLEHSSPIHRGVLLARNMLGRVLRPPQEAFTPLDAGAHPKLTTRQRVALQTKPAACKSCHDLINPLGFTLEKYDAIGKFRKLDNALPVDSSGSYQTRNGTLAKFTDARDLAKFLADSDEAHNAFIEKLFHHLVKQPARAYGVQTLPKLQRSFKANQYNIRKLMVEIIAETALKG